LSGFARRTTVPRRSAGAVMGLCTATSTTITPASRAYSWPPALSQATTLRRPRLQCERRWV